MLAVTRTIALEARLQLSHGMLDIAQIALRLG